MRNFFLPGPVRKGTPGPLLRAFLPLLLLSLGAGRTAAGIEENRRAFAEANQAYQQGNFEAAIPLYEKLVRQDVRQAAVYYNLGNAYFKSGKLGLAIANFERARRLEPSDRDIAENLAFARAGCADKVEEKETPFWLSGLLRFHHLLPYGKQLWLTVLFWALANLAWGLRQAAALERWKNLAPWVAALLLALTLVSGLSAFLKLPSSGPTEAILRVEKSDLLSGPAEGNAVLATLHEGFKVEIRQQTADWCQAVLPNGWNGWIRRSHLEIL